MVESIIMEKYLKTENRIAIGSYIFLAYFLIMMGARALGAYEGTTVYTVILVISMLLWGAKMIITPYTPVEYAIAASLMIIAGIVYLNTGEKGLIVCFATLTGMKYVSKIKVLRYGAIIASICIIGRIVLGVFGFTSEKYYPQVRAGVGEMFRHSLGYAHPNTLHMNVLMLSMLIIYLVSIRGNLKQILMSSALVFGFNLYVFQYSGSRTGLLACTAYLIVNIWFYIRRTPGIPEKVVCYCAYPAVCLVAIVMPVVLPDRIAELLDQTIFNSRITLARFFWTHNSLSLWGIRLNKPDPQYRTYGLDMAHLYLFLQLGVIAFIVITVLTMGYVYMALKKGYMAELAVLMGTLFAGIWEPFLYNLGFKNLMYVFMGAMLYELTQELSLNVAQPEQVRNDTSTGISLLEPRRVMIYLLIAGSIGILSSVLYSVVTPVPSALYGDNESDEAGKSLGMEPVYLTETETAALIDRGDIVIGYHDAETPMYVYDESLAIMEYHKKIISIGVWITILILGVLTVRSILLQKCDYSPTNSSI